MKRLLQVACAVLGFGVPWPASGGVGPSPFHLLIGNRADLVDVSSELHGQAMTDLVLHLLVANGVSDTGGHVQSEVLIPLSVAGSAGRVVPASAW